MYITLKPWAERNENATQIVARLSQKMQGVEGIRLFMQPAQDVSVGGRLSRTQYQYTLSDPDGDELNPWAPQVLDKLRSLPGLADVTSDPAGAGLDPRRGRRGEERLHVHRHLRHTGRVRISGRWTDSSPFVITMNPFRRSIRASGH